VDDPTPLTTLAVDLGTKRVGFAVVDPLGLAITPLPMGEVTQPEQAVTATVTLAEARGAGRIVVGLPLNMDGTRGPSAKAAEDFARRIRHRTGLPVVLVDERQSSLEAEQRLVDRKRAGERMTRKGKKRRLDSVAAVVLLERFLQGQGRPLEPMSQRSTNPA
jgi:putative Holliday junction resolvase